MLAGGKEVFKEKTSLFRLLIQWNTYVSCEQMHLSLPLRSLHGDSWTPFKVEMWKAARVVYLCCRREVVQLCLRIMIPSKMKVSSGELLKQHASQWLWLSCLAWWSPKLDFNLLSGLCSAEGSLLSCWFCNKWLSPK